jgi:hypothetical protein
VRIGILTFHAVPNYGAVLQAYALQRYLEGCGHEAEFIDYRPAYLTTGGRFHWPKSLWHLKANVVIAYQKVMALKGRLDADMRKQHDRFDQFTNNYLNLSRSRYNTLNDLRENPPDYDVYICGSDQIWNPSEQYGLDPACFLNFGPKMVKKISYAASFGRTVIPERHHREVALYSEALDSISVREASGSSMLKRLLDRESHLVPDPTFLIDWSSIETKRLSQGKLFSYVLRSGDGLYDFQRELGEELDLDVIQPLNPHQRWKSYGEIIPMSPMEWLGAIQRSSAVVTNSFHGTVFAILFNRPFLSVKLGGAKSDLNERMYHLLTSLDLISRQISLGDRKSASTRMNQPIDWKHVNKRVATMKARGVDFLSVAMGG